MLLKNVCIENNNNPVNIRIENNIFQNIEKNLEALDGEDIIDCTGKIIMPPFVESHVHLDTCLTAGEPSWNLSGTLFEGIEIWNNRKKSLTKADVKERALKAIKMQVSNGIQYIRTHVDITDENLVALTGILELKEELKNFVDIQVVAFPQEGILSTKNGKILLENAIILGADVIGAIPHFEFTREYGIDSINYIFELAKKYNKLIDVHCDETDDEQSRFLETVACRAYEEEIGHLVTASHTTAMHSYNGAYTSKLFKLLQLSKINFVSNPLVNTNLQGRFDTYPKRRGITRIKELLEAGINVSFGHDNIFDSWYPLGTGNMLDVLHLGLHVSQMLGYKEILDSYNLITYNGAKTLNIKQYGILEGEPANFIILNGNNFYNILNRKAEVLYSFKNGQLISASVPSVQRIFF